MENRLLALIDLDGTLLSHRSKISKHNLEGIKQFLIDGNQIAICTGRWPVSATIFNDTIEKFTSLKNKYLISLNGSLIFNLIENKIIYESLIDSNIFSQLVNLIKDNNFALWIYSKKGIENRKIYTHKINLKWLMNKFNYGKIVDLKEMSNDDEIYKILVFNFGLFSHKKFTDFGQLLKNNFEKDLTVSLTSRHCIEITGLNASKGDGLDFLSNLEKINPLKFVAIGDSGNDISMFKKAGHKICLGNKNKTLYSWANKQIKNKKGVKKALDYVKNINFNFDKEKTLLIDFTGIKYFNINQSEFNKYEAFWNFLINQNNIAILSHLSMWDMQNMFKHFFINEKVLLISDSGNNIKFCKNKDKYLSKNIFSLTQLVCIRGLLASSINNNPNISVLINRLNDKNIFLSTNKSNYSYFLNNSMFSNENIEFVNLSDNTSYLEELKDVTSVNIFGLDRIPEEANLKSLNVCFENNVLRLSLKNDEDFNYEKIIKKQLSDNILKIDARQLLENNQTIFDEVNKFIIQHFLK
ncbi:Cof-type HAD-IIB family hydrolase [Malacoplasma iowae]|uniref:Hydrolase, HAD superfamily n=1 Tax=Malacoplasma iowae DK-CPA TaxID=1394179 RepID=A0A084U487_MALIO|nr:Cof-type HAD-IIB family hydrolase [Malacoplasma iowae]KFB07773.1 hydrolase, HAD superfamily [Malacoplasma iowae DK-CPA]WPL37066.1 Cof-type HAD-IIB family hydrolase [Malacoplasma iowae]WPL38246.1 Cof-type HAD-IIB family hydrolase [Malacoplasma iowae]WPL40621.1 Cof-type HAD-IIB family hydrolase [Malacoplasma iowae]